jgi:tetratricopeptide (TPR) repeat protein
VLTEEALVLIATLVGGGLSALGALELIAPTRPRRPRRRPPERTLPRSPEPVHVVAAPAVAVPEVALVPVSVGVSASAVRARCEALFDEERYADVVAEATRALGPRAHSLLTPAEAAALWSLIGRARHAVGDEQGARAALESALTLAPEATRPEHERWLGVLSLSVARARLDAAVGDGPVAPEERVDGIRVALQWLHRGQVGRGLEGALGELAAVARAALWPAYEEAVKTLAQRHEYERARRLLGEALAEPDVPPDRQETFRTLLSTLFSTEIGHLSAQAIRSLHASREIEALSALERAEDLIDTMPDDALSTTRREEVDRRLLSGYTRLGHRRLENGEFEEAMAPLLRAVRVPLAGADVRAALVRALDGVVDTRGADIRRLADQGEREQALAARDELWSRLVNARAAGLSRDDLQPAVTKARRLFVHGGLDGPQAP